MAESITEPIEIQAVGKLVPNGSGYVVSITRDYAEDLRRITSKRVLVTIKPLV
jgi:hypothetical protein